MIAPLIFTLDPVYENLSQTWVFFKAISLCKEQHWPVIAQHQYFDQWEEQKRLFPQFFKESVCDMFEFDIPKKLDMEQIVKIEIPVDIEQAFIKKHGTQSDAYIASIKEDWPELENYLVEMLSKVSKEKDEPLEAITSLTYIKFVQNVADRLGVPVIYYEWGPFRYSSYRNTAYFDINRKYKNVLEMYKQFKKDPETANLPMFSKEEILAIFLNEEYLRYLYDNRIEEVYELGIIGGYHSLTETSAYTHFNILEIYNTARKLYDEKDIAVRYHPGDPVHSRLGVANEKKGELIDFILSCKRLVCIASNVEVEAMAYGKYVYDMTDFKYKGIVNKNLEEYETEQYVPDEILNFIVFVSIVPFEFLNSVQYLRFRLSNPSFKEIYLYHAEYYMNCIGCGKGIMYADKGNRLESILNIRKKGEDLDVLVAEEIQSEIKQKALLQKLKKERIRLRRELFDAMTEIEKLETLKEQMEDHIQEKDKYIEQIKEQKRALENENQGLRDENYALEHSLSMRVTRPIRLFKRFLRRTGRRIVNRGK